MIHSKQKNPKHTKKKSKTKGTKKIYFHHFAHILLYERQGGRKKEKDQMLYEPKIEGTKIIFEDCKDSPLNRRWKRHESHEISKQHPSN